MVILMESYVFTELAKKGLKVKFWRTGSGAEVDFVVNNIPIAVKSAVLKEPALSRSFYRYLRAYRPKEQ
jgi:predicted AAA+ superfamily ATPase